MGKKVKQYIWLSDKKSKRKLDKLKAKVGLNKSCQPEIVLCFQSNVEQK
tara:strand:+ start:273 stop:419 length:147 start_codon:yes stop_codon:yes gene_type:complete